MFSYLQTSQSVVMIHFNVYLQDSAQLFQGFRKISFNIQLSLILPVCPKDLVQFVIVEFRIVMSNLPSLSWRFALMCNYLQTSQSTLNIHFNVHMYLPFPQPLHKMHFSPRNNIAVGLPAAQSAQAVDTAVSSLRHSTLTWCRHISAALASFLTASTLMRPHSLAVTASQSLTSTEEKTHNGQRTQASSAFSALSCSPTSWPPSKPRWCRRVRVPLPASQEHLRMAAKHSRVCWLLVSPSVINSLQELESTGF